MYGAGNVSAYRGRAYMVLAKEDVTDQRGAWSQWKVRVFRGADARYTTPPYPVFTVDGHDSASAVHGGRDIVYPIEGYDSVSDIRAADLYSLLQTHVMDPEGYDSASTIESADLRDTLKTHTLAPEGYDSESDLAGADLRTTLLTYSPQPEGYDSASNLHSANLT